MSRLQKKLFAVAVVTLVAGSLYAECAGLAIEPVYADAGITVSSNEISLAEAGEPVAVAPLLEKGTWQFTDYKNHLHAEYGRTIDGVRSVYVGGNTSDCNTAWCLLSPVTLWTGKGRRYIVSWRMKCTRGLIRPGWDKQNWTCLMFWYETPQGKSIAAQPFTFALDEGHFATISVSGTVPEKARYFRIQFGFDIPDLKIGDSVALSEVAVYAPTDKVVYEREGSFESDLQCSGPVSWRAKVPQGTAVEFQCAEGDDRTSALAAPFHGPDGTAATRYSAAFVPKGRYFRYKAYLRASADRAQTPVLVSVRVGNSKAREWSFLRDSQAPGVDLVSASPTTNANEKLRLRVRDASPIRYESFRARVDGVDVTALFKRSGDVYSLEGRAEPWDEGIHHFEVDIEDCRGNRRTAKRLFVIGEVPSGHSSTLRDDGVVLYDGKPVFPVGPYFVRKCEFNGMSIERAFAGLKEGGFNFAQTYYSIYEDEFLDMAEKYGCWLWVRCYGREEAYQINDDFLRRGRKSPAVLAWYLADDTADYTSPNELEDRAARIKAADPRHITCQADTIASKRKRSRYEKYVNLTDVFMPEIYPVRGKAGDPSDTNCVAETIRDMERVRSDVARFGNGRPRACWPILQYFTAKPNWFHFPSRQQLFATTWAAVVHGAHGMTWYVYGDAKKESAGMCSTPERWKDCCDLATQLKGLADVLTERTGPQPPVPTVRRGPSLDPLGQPSVTCLLKCHSGRNYLIAVNASPEPVVARFALGESGEAEVLFENGRKVTFKNSLEDSFEPLGVHIYRYEVGK